MNQRKEPRRDYIARVTITFRNGKGQQEHSPALIEDRSKSGFGIQSPKAIPEETLIQIRQGSEIYLGIVRHCHAHKNGFFIGVEKVDDSGQKAAAEYNAP